MFTPARLLDGRRLPTCWACGAHHRRASRQIKALAQAHLDALQEKMREMVAMQKALERLLNSCHGDDHPHCAILDELAVSSEGTPAPGTVVTRTARKSGAKPAGARADTRAEPTAHIELMAWTRSAHASRGNH